MTPAALWARALGVALCAHSGLLDYAQRGWGGAHALTLASGLLLCLTPAALPAPAPGYSAAARLRAAHARLAPLPPLLGALAKLYTLTQLRDVLTQSLLLVGLLGLCAAALWAEARGGAGAARGHARAAAGLGALTYLAAALHKVNVDFLSTPQSCALHAADAVLAALDLRAPLRGALLAHLPAAPLAVGVIAAEGALAWGVWRGRRWAWALGAAFHLPLTLTLAPAFGLVMLATYVAAHAATQG
ncbi:MAG: hypothetical protein FJ138_17590, partial [Deltaproteobacteria bacterium]|nr:hypothetical protein [Deltaproteobacteria bacterium]